MSFRGKAEDLGRWLKPEEKMEVLRKISLVSSPHTLAETFFVCVAVPNEAVLQFSLTRTAVAKVLLDMLVLHVDSLRISPFNRGGL